MTPTRKVGITLETLTEAMKRIKDNTSLKEFCEDYLEPRGRDTYVCPFCNSGNGPNHSAAFHIRGDSWKCFSCDESGDIFDLAGKINKTDDKAEQANLVAAWTGIEGWKSSDRQDSDVVFGWDDIGVAADEQQPKHEDTPKQSKAPDYSVGRERHRAYIEAMQSNIEQPEAVAYLSSRGISLEMARAWGLGYDPNPKNAWQDTQGDWHRCGRIVIPWPSVGGEAPYYHVDRAADDRAKNGKYVKPRSEEVGSQPIWNPKALNEPAFFVVEGQLDALAVQACGFEAIAVGGSGHGDLVDAITKESTGFPILLFDADDTGREASSKLAASLKDAGIACRTGNVERFGVKDAFDAFVRNREGLASFLKEGFDGAIVEKHIELMKKSHVVNPANVVCDLYDLREARAPIPTGFTYLDNALGGGLHAKSLHIVGAQSSEGKTTFTLQVCDNIAKSGRPALFVTIEQRADELIAKSLSRIIREEGRSQSLSARDIMNPMARKEWTNGQMDAFRQACEVYTRDIAPYLHFMDPDAQPNVKSIEEWARVMGEMFDEMPCVFVDYLQLLAPESERDTEKQVTDKNVTALRQMAGRLNTPVWCVASLNRQSYTSPIDTDSFKESGAIEYGADVLMGIEPFDLETRWHNADSKKKPLVAKGMHDKTRKAVKRWMDLRILKSRFGPLPECGLAYVYYANADTFEAVGRIKRERRGDGELVKVGPTDCDYQNYDDDELVF